MADLGDATAPDGWVLRFAIAMTDAKVRYRMAVYRRGAWYCHLKAHQCRVGRYITTKKKKYVLTDLGTRALAG